MKLRSSLNLKIFFATAIIVSLGAYWRLAGSKQKEHGLKNHPAKQMAFWQQNVALQLPLQHRFFETPDALIDLLRKDNINQGWPNRPINAVVADSVKEQLASAIAEIPDFVLHKASPLLVGIFFVKDLGGTAFSDYIFDEKGNPAGGFIVFDELILKKTANEWATWKERSPYKNEPVNLHMLIEDAATDDMRHAFQFVFLHELGHILSINAKMTPPWGESPSTKLHPKTFTFSKLSWSIKDRRYTRLFGNEILDQIQFYKGNSLANPTQAYAALEKSNFPTMYSTTGPEDDFADSFASYVHTVLMGKPYSVLILNEPGDVKKYESCWGSPRCAEKEQILFDFLK